jgi:hypothetical protein
MNPLKFYWCKPEFGVVYLLQKNFNSVVLHPADWKTRIPESCFLSKLEAREDGMVKVWFCHPRTLKLLKSKKLRDEMTYWINPICLCEIDMV